jgi:hypothetical protein
MKTFAVKIIAIETLIIIMLSGIIYRGCQSDRKGTPLPADNTISRVTVTPEAPLVGQDKSQLRKRRVITKDIAKNPDKAVLTTTKIKDSDGSRSVAAVLDIKTGETQLVEKRPVLETMHRFEIGIGYGFESGDLARAFTAQGTIGRLGPFYCTGRIEYFDVDRPDNRHPWNAMAFATVRF